MATTTPEQELDAVRLETLNLLITFHVYRHAFTVFAESLQRSRHHVYCGLVTIKALEHDLILRLCRLVDDKRTDHSLHRALLAVRAGLGEQRARKIDRMLDDYHNTLKPLKERRDEQIAHLAKLKAEPGQPTEDIRADVIAQVVRIVDAICQSEICYSMKLGSQEPEVDVRAEVLGRG